FGGEAPHYVNSHLGVTAERLADGIVNTMMGTIYRGGKWVLVVCPEHAAVFKRAGWSRERVGQRLFERPTRPLAQFKRLNGLPDWAITPQDEQTPYRYMNAPDDVLIVAAGGSAGGFSAIVPPWAAGADSLPVTRAIGVCIDCN